MMISEVDLAPDQVQQMILSDNLRELLKSQIQVCIVDFLR